MQLPSIIRSIYKGDKSAPPPPTPSGSTSDTLSPPLGTRLGINRNRATSLRVGHGHRDKPPSPSPSLRLLNHLTVSPSTPRRWSSLRRSKKDSPSPKNQRKYITFCTQCKRAIYALHCRVYMEMKCTTAQLECISYLYCTSETSAI
eukprot:sb/3473836/